MRSLSKVSLLKTLKIKGDISPKKKKRTGQRRPPRQKPPGWGQPAGVEARKKTEGAHRGPYRGRIQTSKNGLSP